MLRTTRKLCLTIVASALMLVAANPHLGTWKLNTTESKFSPSTAPPKSSVLVISQDGDWIVHQTEIVGADGTTRKSSNRYKTDGKEYPWQGPNGPGKLRVKIIDDYHANWVFTDDSGATIKGSTVVSQDGKKRTQSATGVNSKGQKIHGVQVFDKQ